LTYADLCIYNTMDQMVLAGVGGWQDLQRYQHINALVRRIEETPRFAGYLKARPPAAF